MEQDVRKILSLTRENNEILRKIDGRQKRASFFKFLYWIVIAVGLIISYIYLEPYIEVLREAYITASQTIQEVKQAGETVNGAFGR